MLQKIESSQGAMMIEKEQKRARVSSSRERKLAADNRSRYYNRSPTGDTEARVFPELPGAFVLTMRTRRFTDCRLMLTNVPRIRAYIIRRIIATVRAWIRVQT